MAVRSKVLASAVATTTLTTIYTVPAGRTAIIKQLSIYNPSGGATTTLFVSMLIGGSARGLFLETGIAPNSSSGATAMYVVLGPGDSLRISANPSSALQFTAHGVELDGVAP